MKRVASSVFILLVLLPFLAHAGSVQVMGTRFVYEAGEPEITVNLTNGASRAALVQAWLDEGDPSTQPGTKTLPFLANPPLARIEPGQGQALRIIQIDNNLPRDRESVFWINVLDIPTELETGVGQNSMQLAFRSRLKLFYRPPGLSGTLTSAAEGLRWRLVSTGDGYELTAQNSSPYHVSLSRVTLKANHQGYDAKAGTMIEPYGSLGFPLVDRLSSIPAAAEVEAVWIDDDGTNKVRKYEID